MTMQTMKIVYQILSSKVNLIAITTEGGLGDSGQGLRHGLGGIWRTMMMCKREDMRGITIGWA